MAGWAMARRVGWSRERLGERLREGDVVAVLAWILFLRAVAPVEEQAALQGGDGVVRLEDEVDIDRGELSAGVAVDGEVACLEAAVIVVAVAADLPAPWGTVGARREDVVVRGG